MSNDQHHQPTEQETALIAVRTGRVAELQQQMDLILLRSLVRENEQAGA